MGTVINLKESLMKISPAHSYRESFVKLVSLRRQHMRVSQPSLEQPQMGLEAIREALEEIKAKVESLLHSVSEIAYTGHPYVIRKDEIHGGRPIIAGTRIPVSTIVERIQLGDTPEDVVRDFPPLTLAQVYDALSYYYEHKQEIDAEIADNRNALKWVSQRK